MGMLSPAEPGQPETPAMDFLVTMNPAGFFTGAIPMSLYGILEADPTAQRIPMGDAAVALDFSNQQMPIKSIGLTSYENAQAKGWRDLMFKMEQKDQDLVLTIDNMVYSSADRNDAKLANSTIVTMTDNTKDLTLKDTKSAVRSVINRVVTELATEGKVAPYRMLVETNQDMNGDGVITADEKLPVMDVEVTPAIVGTNAVAEMNIKSYAYDETTHAQTVTNMTVNATADMTSEIIKVDVIPEGSPVSIASAYFKSNALGIVTSNDNIAVSDLKVTPVEGGLYIANNGKATYRIINMTGATLVNGTVSGDNAYISTSSLAKGIYIIVVTENGVSQSVKFVR
ncbi:T9SS C-terminal target domain-containing protein [Parabacteroides sp. AF48-14]|uniref:T9SS type A sorting domain-containing protein n=1 Tax=Parabacteroides sp. AF48-14 TaxID=2292052 RepID=UPI000F005FB0|nr:T9SS type A sorting domain-containing protein [Parabacteroides sp. AF48-14]RHO68326.1 T9SS C-terminal target domain-containing protein [Parabacteroides sp. AF48-14]